MIVCSESEERFIEDVQSEDIERIVEQQVLQRLDLIVGFN